MLVNTALLSTSPMPNKHQYDLIVIGGGAAGLTTASGAAQLGARTLLVNAQPDLGGDCLHHGCVPSKALLHAAKVARTVRTSAAAGIDAPLERVDWQQVKQHIQHAQAVIQEHDATERFQKLGVEVIIGRARFLDPHTIEIATETDTQTLTSRMFCIATGSRPFIPPIPGIDTVDYLTNETVFTMSELPQSMAIVGAGPIGCELGQAFARLGVAVTLINRAAHILDRESDRTSTMMESVFRQEQISLVLDGEIMSVSRTPERHIETIFQHHDGNTQEIQTESLLIATGRVPAIDTLNLEAAGVASTRRGITVDDRLRTSQRHIYAAGDCNGMMPFTHSAGHQGSVVVSNAIIGIPQKANFWNTPRVTYTAPEIASIGDSAQQLDNKGTPYTTLTSRYDKQDRALTEADSVGYVELRVDKRGRLLGGDIIATNAGEMLPELVLLRQQRLSVRALLSTIHAYPTRAELIKTAISQHYGKQLFSDRVRSILRFLWNYRGKNIK